MMPPPKFQARASGAPGPTACRCPIVLAVLRTLGATHAAEMHARGIDAPFSADDWRRHFDEEERLIVPALRRAGVSPRTLGFLLQDHEIFLDELERYKWIASVERLARHAAAEDEIVGKYLGRLVR